MIKTCELIRKSKMNWLKNFVPPKLRKLVGSQKEVRKERGVEAARQKRRHCHRHTCDVITITEIATTGCRHQVEAAATVGCIWRIPIATTASKTTARKKKKKKKNAFRPPAGITTNPRRIRPFGKNPSTVTFLQKSSSSSGASKNLRPRHRRRRRA